MCQEEAALISSLLFGMTLVVGFMGVVFFKAWKKDRTKEDEVTA